MSYQLSPSDKKKKKKKKKKLAVGDSEPRRRLGLKKKCFLQNTKSSSCLFQLRQKKMHINKTKKKIADFREAFFVCDVADLLFLVTTSISQYTVILKNRFGERKHS